MKYAVVVYYSIQSDSVVYLFDDYTEALNYTGKMWEHCYNVALAENEEKVNTYACYHEDEEAAIYWKDGEKRMWQVIGTSEPLKIN